MTQLVANDLCKCSFGVDNVVVFLIIPIITGNFHIVNMYKITNARKVEYFCLFTPNCLFTSNWVKVRDSL